MYPGVPEVSDVDSFGIVKGIIAWTIELAAAGTVLTPIVAFERFAVLLGDESAIPSEDRDDPPTRPA